MTTPLFRPPGVEVALSPEEWLDLVYLSHCCSRRQGKELLKDLGAYPSELETYLDHVKNLPFARQIGEEIARRVVNNDRRADPRQHIDKNAARR